MVLFRDERSQVRYTVSRKHGHNYLELGGRQQRIGRHTGEPALIHRGVTLRVSLSRMLLVGALLLAAGLGGTLAARLSAGSPPPTVAIQPVPAAEPPRIERDRTRQCIPERPDIDLTCDARRQALWHNESQDLLRELRARSNPNPSADDAIAAYLQMHVEAGDLNVIAELAHRLRVPVVRAVAVAPAPDDPAAEYVELANLGAVAIQHVNLVLVAPGAGNRFRISGPLAFPGVLAPGRSCRVYSCAAGQPDACGGSWDEPNTRGIWPSAGGWVVLLASEPGRPLREADRWFYRP